VKLMKDEQLDGINELILSPSHKVKYKKAQLSLTNPRDAV